MPETISRDDLVKQLGASMGHEKALDAIQSAAGHLHIRGEEFDRDQTMRILDQLSATPGLVGTVARFAKARVILKFG